MGCKLILQNDNLNLSQNRRNILTNKCLRILLHLYLIFVDDEWSVSIKDIKFVLNRFNENPLNRCTWLCRRINPSAIQIPLISVVRKTNNTVSTHSTYSVTFGYIKRVATTWFSDIYQESPKELYSCLGNHTVNISSQLPSSPTLGIV
jgi:hypothetical protein